MAIEINNQTKTAVDKKLFSTVAKKVLMGENRGTESVSVAFVGKAEMKKLNKKFRHKDKPTNVLSFEINEKDLFGEIIICPDVVKKNAEKYGVSAKFEMIKVFVHGMLHLCGYDHEKSKKDEEIMEALEKKYLSKII